MVCSRSTAAYATSRRNLTVAILSVMVLLTPTPSASSELAIRNRFVSRTVQQAILAAIDRLKNPGCQQVFVDFHNRRNETLQHVLDASHQSAEDHLRTLRFVDGDDEPTCNIRGYVLAFTQLQGAQISVCGRRFAPAFEEDSVVGEVAIIHELLHTLGLPENPPSSAEISDRVFKRCIRNDKR